MDDASAERGLWSTVLAAVRGSKEELTEIPVGRAVMLLAVPTVLEMSMESLFAVVDIFFVSKLGSDAVAAVGLTESFLSLAYAVSMGLAAAATATIARRTGEKDLDGAGRAAVHVIFAAVVASAVLGLAGALFARRLLALMGASASVIASGSSYTAIMLGGSATIFLLIVVNAAFRGAGDAAVAMRTLWLANGLNIVLAPCFIFGLGPFPRMGVAGAAVATTLSRGVGVAYQIATLARGRGRLVILKEHFVLRARMMVELVSLASGASLQTLIETASWLGLVRILSTFGSAALAGYTIAMRVAIFALMPAWGIASSAATLVGQNLGAKKPERAERSVRTIARYNVGFLALVGALFVLVPSPIVRLFTEEPDVIPMSADALRVVSLGFLFFAYGMVAVQAFNGAGDTRTPMLINLACFWLFKIPLAWLLSTKLGLGPRGVFVAISAAYSVQSLVAGALFRRGSWKSVVVP